MKWLRTVINYNNNLVTQLESEDGEDWRIVGVYRLTHLTQYDDGALDLRMTNEC